MNCVSMMQHTAYLPHMKQPGTSRRLLSGATSLRKGHANLLCIVPSFSWMLSEGNPVFRSDMSRMNLGAAASGSPTLRPVLDDGVWMVEVLGDGEPGTAVLLRDNKNSYIPRFAQERSVRKVLKQVRTQTCAVQLHATQSNVACKYEVHTRLRNLKLHSNILDCHTVLHSSRCGVACDCEN